MAEVIGAEMSLKPIFGFPIGNVHNASVVDKNVQAVIFRFEFCSELVDRDQGTEVKGNDFSGGIGDLVFDHGESGYASFQIAASENGVGPLAGDLFGGFKANTAIRPSDDNDFAIQIGHVFCRPMVVRVVISHEILLVNLLYLFLSDSILVHILGVLNTQNYI